MSAVAKFAEAGFFYATRQHNCFQQILWLDAKFPAQSPQTRENCPSGHTNSLQVCALSQYARGFSPDSLSLRAQRVPRPSGMRGASAPTLHRSPFTAICFSPQRRRVRRAKVPILNVRGALAPTLHRAPQFCCQGTERNQSHAGGGEAAKCTGKRDASPCSSFPLAQHTRQTCRPYLARTQAMARPSLQFFCAPRLCHACPHFHEAKLQQASRF